MLLQRYWQLITCYWGNNDHVGHFWNKYMKGNTWGLGPSLYTSGEISKAWQNHRMQPSRGFFSQKHIRSNDSLYEIAAGFALLYKERSVNAQKSIQEIATELFKSDVATALCEAHGDAVEELMAIIKSEEDQDFQKSALMASIFWFCFSVRATNKKQWDAWRENPNHDIPRPQNRYADIKVYLYKKMLENSHPETKWIVRLAENTSLGIKPNMNLGSAHISYDIENGFIGIPNAWHHLSSLYEECPELFKQHYTDRKTRIEYNSPIVGIMSSRTKNSAPPAIDCTCYEIDYLTHRVLEDVIQDIKINQPQLLETRGIDPSKLEYYECTNESFGYLRSSVGTNTIVDIPKDNVIILHIRGRNAAYGNAYKLYPSVVETLDLVKENRDFDIINADPITACVTRGLSEELGIPDILRPRRSFLSRNPVYTLENIKHVAFARTKDFHQDNFFSIVTLNPDVGLNDVIQMAQNASEYRIEIDNIIAISNDPQDIIEYMIANDHRFIHQTRYALWLYMLHKSEMITTD